MNPMGLQFVNLAFIDIFFVLFFVVVILSRYNDLMFINAFVCELLNL